jgi:uncharacterized DUF497 family protein
MRFEWDADKAASNFLKHGVSFNEAREVFYDPNAVEEYDAGHSSAQVRFFVIGLSSRRLLYVVYAETSSAVRIISARKPTRAERKIYEGRNN